MWLHLPQASSEETKLFLLLRPVGGALGSRGSRLTLALSPWAASQSDSWWGLSHLQPLLLTTNPERAFDSGQGPEAPRAQ